MCYIRVCDPPRKGRSRRNLQYLYPVVSVRTALEWACGRVREPRQWHSTVHGVVSARLGFTHGQGEVEAIPSIRQPEKVVSEVLTILDAPSALIFS